MIVHAIGLNYTHSSHFSIQRPNGSGDYLFLCFRTPAILCLEGKEYRAEKNSAILFNRGTPQVYRAGGSYYTNDFIHFDAKAEPDLHNLPLDVLMQLPSTKQIGRILKDLYLEYISTNAKRAESMDLLLRLLFVKLHELTTYQPEDTVAYGYYDSLLGLRSMIYRHPEEKWTVARLAHQVSLSPSHFQRLYRKTFGTTCIADVISCKLQYAKTSLTATSDTVRDIAARCGYENEEHFMRQFKQYMGMTPTEYRLMNHEFRPAGLPGKPLG